MARNTDLILTAIAPAIWGSTYLVTTEFLPDGYPLTISLLRALPAGFLLLLLVRKLPSSAVMWLKTFILGAFNFSIFWWLIFVAAYRLPGGTAAILGAIQPLIVIFLARMILGSKIYTLSIIAAIAGMLGVALLILTPQATLDPIGISAGLGGAVSMACGTVLSRRWQAGISPLTFTAWQLTAGGILLLPAALWLEPEFPTLTTTNIIGITYLGLIGAALTYILWFRGIAKFEPSIIAPLGFLAPVSAVILGWIVLNQSLSPLQFLGVTIVLGSVWIGQRAGRPSNPAAAKKATD
ncbi:MAG: EamA family transporter [Hyphomicrobiales bacterium]|nr:MAG: EamA family transporter [Hyphomicrobiales bacterium]